MSDVKLVHVRFTGRGYVCGKLGSHYYNTSKARLTRDLTCIACIVGLQKRVRPPGGRLPPPYVVEEE